MLMPLIERACFRARVERCCVGGNRVLPGGETFK